MARIDNNDYVDWLNQRAMRGRSFFTKDDFEGAFGNITEGSRAVALSRLVEGGWFTGKAMLTTYHLEELVGTKVRALYQRKKGRDLFDLYTALTARELELVDVKVIEADLSVHKPLMARFVF